MGTAQPKPTQDSVLLEKAYLMYILSDVTPEMTVCLIEKTSVVPETVDARDDTTADEILIRRRREML